jgi:hypothetical protein
VSRRYEGRPNVKIVRARKTGDVVRVLLRDTGDGPVRDAEGGSASGFTYDEPLRTGKLKMLKRYDEQTGTFVCWSASDGFNPFRFNPDKFRKEHDDNSH